MYNLSYITVRIVCASKKKCRQRACRVRTTQFKGAAKRLRFWSPNNMVMNMVPIFILNGIHHRDV